MTTINPMMPQQYAAGNPYPAAPPYVTVPNQNMPTQPTQFAPQPTQPQAPAVDPASMSAFLQMAGYQPQAPQIPQPQQPQSSGIREALMAKGFPAEALANATDAELMDTFVSGLTNAKAYEDLQNRYNQIIPVIQHQQRQLAQVQQPMMQPAPAEPQQPAKPGRKYQPPEFDQSYMQYVTFDEASGRYVPANPLLGTAIADKVNNYLDYKRKFNDTFIQNPKEIILDSVKEDIEAIVQDRLNQARAEQQAEQEYHQAANFVIQNFDKFFAVGPDGNPIQDPYTGEYQHTPQGKAFLHFRKEASDLGISNPVKAQKYATEKLEAFEFQARAQMQAQAAMAQQPQFDPNMQQPQQFQQPQQPQQPAAPQQTFGVAESMAEFNQNQEGYINVPGQENPIKLGPEPAPAPGEQPRPTQMPQPAGQQQVPPQQPAPYANGNGNGYIPQPIQNRMQPQFPQQPQYQHGVDPRTQQASQNDAYLANQRQQQAALRTPTHAPSLPSEPAIDERAISADAFMSIATDVARQSGIPLT